MPPLTSRLPALYHHLLPSFFEESYPDERLATCKSCVLCQTPESPTLPSKCCTYHPNLPNYLVGGILGQGDDSAGRRRVEGLIAHRWGVTPLGVFEPPQYTALSRHLKKGDVVRTAADAVALLCPFYDRGECTVWAHREHLCSTFFCYSVAGRAGGAFWKVFNEYLMFVEARLARHALARLATTVADGSRYPPQLPVLTPLEGPPVIDVPAYDALWGRWRGREAELFSRCHEAVSMLSREETADVLGEPGAAFLRRLADALSEFRREVLPERLRLGPYRIEPLDGEHVQIVTPEASVRVPRIAAVFMARLAEGDTATTVVRLAAQVRMDLVPYLSDARAAGVLTDVQSST